MYYFGLFIPICRGNHYFQSFCYSQRHCRCNVFHGNQGTIESLSTNKLYLLLSECFHFYLLLFYPSYEMINKAGPKEILY